MRGGRTPARWAGAALAASCLLSAAACSGPAGRLGGRGQTSTSRATGTSGTTVPGDAGAQPLPAATPSTAAFGAQAGWRVVSEAAGAVVVDERAVTEPDGSLVTVARFRAGGIQVGLHVGSTDPPAGAANLPASAASAVSATERSRLVAAFNGGFHTRAVASSGGFEVAGQVLRPLVDGLASVVVDANGSATVGVWGQGLPVPGTPVVSVRQNLQPLVAGGAPSPMVGDIGAWGATLGGGSAVARSALGEDAAGDLVYAASMSALPADLAAALVGVRVTTAMELDINPEWVQLDVAATPGGPLSAAIPGQVRPADQYISGWTRDFFTVLARG